MFPRLRSYAAILLCGLVAVAGCGRDAEPRPAQAVPPAAGADWCAGHGVPESMCPKCNAGVEEKYRAAGDWCEAHGFPESVCPSCNPMDPPQEQAPASGTRIRFRSPTLEQTAGIEVQSAQEAGMALEIRCTARVDFDRNRLADVRTAVPGLVREVAVDLGQPVEQGTLLFVLESARAGDLTARHTAARKRVETARANLARLEDLRARRIPSARQVELAHQELDAAEAELHSIEQTLRLTGGAASGVSGRVAIRSPRAGTVVRRPAVVGAFATEADSLATVADTSRMWALLDVNERDASKVRVGQQVAVEVDGVPDRVFRGSVSWIASEVDARTRTVTVRAEVDNQDGLLRARHFARATIEIAPSASAVTVPAESVQRFDQGPVVFVRTAPLVYEPRAVELGRSDSRRVQIVSDVRPGDQVVTTGAFLLKTELMRGSIGAGCCEIAKPDQDR